MKAWQGRGLASAAGALAVLGAAALFTGSGVAAEQAAPVNTSPPTVSGTAQVGQKLTGVKGEWSGSPKDYDLLWTRCDKDGGAAPLSGAEQATYMLKGVDVGNTLRFKVEAVNGDGRCSPRRPRPQWSARPAPPPPPPPPVAATGCAANAPLQASKLALPSGSTSTRSISPSIVGRSTNTVTLLLPCHLQGGRRCRARSSMWRRCRSPVHRAG